MNTTQEIKSEFINWFSDLEDQNYIQEIIKLKEDFEKREFQRKIKDGYTIEEAKKESIKRLHKWWKK